MTRKSHTTEASRQAQQKQISRCDKSDQWLIGPCTPVLHGGLSAAALATRQPAVGLDVEQRQKSHPHTWKLPFSDVLDYRICACVSGAGLEKITVVIKPLKKWD